MSHRSTLRIAVLAAVAAGAVLVPSAAAFASDATPTPAASAVPPAATTPTAAPPAAGEPTTMPRGGVAAGERPAGNGSDATALYGSAIGTVLLAGVGTLVLRRRTAVHRAS